MSTNTDVKQSCIDKDNRHLPEPKSFFLVLGFHVFAGILALLGIVIIPSFTGILMSGIFSVCIMSSWSGSWNIDKTGASWFVWSFSTSAAFYFGHVLWWTLHHRFFSEQTICLVVIEFLLLSYINNRLEDTVIYHFGKDSNATCFVGGFKAIVLNLAFITCAGIWIHLWSLIFSGINRISL